MIAFFLLLLRTCIHFCFCFSNTLQAVLQNCCWHKRQKETFSLSKKLSTFSFFTLFATMFVCLLGKPKREVHREESSDLDLNFGTLKCPAKIKFFCIFNVWNKEKNITDKKSGSEEMFKANNNFENLFTLDRWTHKEFVSMCGKNEWKDKRKKKKKAREKKEKRCYVLIDLCANIWVNI